MIRKAFDVITSLKLTIACLAAAAVLVFAGTLAQVNYGIHIVQERYFQSFFVWWPPAGGGFKFPVFPGGHLIGAVLLINLIAAHARRFQEAVRRAIRAVEPVHQDVRHQARVTWAYSRRSPMLRINFPHFAVSDFM